MSDAPPLLAMRGVNLALLGENGAGKSTLMKVLGGAHVAEERSIEINWGASWFMTPGASSFARGSHHGRNRRRPSFRTGGNHAARDCLNG